MKRVVFFRHGKSDWGAGATDDHSRPINDRGRKAAMAMGRFLTLSGQLPDRIVSSSARRTRETIELAIDAGGWARDVEFLDELYLASPTTVIEVIKREPEATRTLLVVGHEPTSSEMVRQLTGQWVAGGGSPIRFPTGTMARVNLGITRWQDCEPGCGQLAWLLPPKLLTKGDFEFLDGS